MSEKKVKVVKRAERSRRNTGSAKAARDSARKAATDMVDTVKNWVNVFQEKQRVDTSTAIDSLIRSRQLPNDP